MVELEPRAHKSGRKLVAIDVGCGSGWKLVNILSAEFHTIGIETEPALSFLQNKYPEQVHFFLVKSKPVVCVQLMAHKTETCFKGI